MKSTCEACDSLGWVTVGELYCVSGHSLCWTHIDSQMQPKSLRDLEQHPTESQDLSNSKPNNPIR